MKHSTQQFRNGAVAAACMACAALASGAACAQNTYGNHTATPATGTSSGYQGNAKTAYGDAHDAYREIGRAAAVLQKMQRAQGADFALQQARGVLVVPRYGRAALGVGLRGGSGVLFVKRNGEWVDPAFYNMGGISVGLQAGGEGGAIVMLLNNQKALDSFKQRNNFSLNADAGLTVVAWSGKGQASAGKGDVSVWSDTKGLFGDLAISVTDLKFDHKETAAYYGRQVTAQNVIEGRITNPHQQALQRSLAALDRGNRDYVPTSLSR